MSVRVCGYKHLIGFLGFPMGSESEKSHCKDQLAEKVLMK